MMKPAHAEHIARVVKLSTLIAASVAVIPYVKDCLGPNRAKSPSDGILYYFSLYAVYRGDDKITPQTIPDPSSGNAFQSDLLYLVPTTIFMLLLRHLFEILVAVPIGKLHDLPNTRQTYERCEILEISYQRERRPNKKTVQKLAELTHKSEIDILRWFSNRRISDKATVQQRFSESLWKALFHFLAFWFGLIVCWDKSWFWQWKECFPNPVNLNVSLGVRIFYFAEMSYYLALVKSQLAFRHRADFWEMLIHHMLSALLLILSWWSYTTRIGALVMVIHDSPDTYLELAKCFKYSNHPFLRDASFAVFAVLFYGTRFAIYPFVPYSCYTSIWENYGATVAHFSLLTLSMLMLVALLMLHGFWCYYVTNAIIQTVIKKKELSDDRSDEEIEEENMIDPDKNKNWKKTN